MEQPELAVLAVLDSALEAASTALIAAYPDTWNPDVVIPEYDPDPSKAAGYAKALICQMNALESTLNSYCHTIRWSCRNRTRTATTGISQFASVVNGEE
jgi:hypothetical protein